MGYPKFEAEGEESIANMVMARTRFFDQIIANGFDTAKTSMFLWEGVSLYLPEQIVNDMLNTLANQAKSGSILVADFYSQNFRIRVFCSFTNGNFSIGI